MKTRRSVICFLLFVCVGVFCFGQNYFPDIPGYRTLVCDFHTHTVFSDGRVWPTMRVDEAQKEGLDAIALSDHIECQPHREDLSTNRNRPFAIAEQRAREKNVLLIKGGEITRDTPPGHYNALFLDDIELLVLPEFLDVIEAANKQKAFVFWNHHAWQGEEKGRWTDLQTTLYEKKWLHGMEVANGSSYYPNAHQWCLEKKMTMLGNSDIHDASINYPYMAQTHRTLTLVFAKERTVESLHEALLSGRTAVWLENRLIGRSDYLKPLFDRCVTVAKPHYIEKRTVYFELSNNALINLQLENIGKSGPSNIAIPAKSAVIVNTTLPMDADTVILSYRVKNFLIEPNKGLPVEFTIS
ncbi:MAG TPA: Sb-PDE family phosphodiesterase, partial [Sedimentisphaerales bacterium]|nr:Sb-PDE family phosphodiesterase [Sedimentisphaerales bacterium]